MKHFCITQILKISLTALLLITAELGATQSWLTVQSPTSRNLRAIFFADSLTGWIGGDSGLIIKTTNGGQSWIQQQTAVRTMVYSVFFTDYQKGFALAWELDNTPPNFYGTRVLQTTNGGSVWTDYLFPDSNFFANSIYFRDAVNGYMCGTEGMIYFTSDAGAVWNPSVVDSGMVFGFPVEEVEFYDENFGYAVGGAFDIAGVIWKTSNSGRSWQTRIVGPEPVNDVHIFDKDNAIGAGGDFEYGSSRVVTNNSGGDWQYTEFGVFGIANTIAFRNKLEGWISLGIIDSFLVTRDGGMTWSMSAVPLQARIYGIEFPDERHGYAIGNNGIILRYNSLKIGINDETLFTPDDFRLSQNFPNPFNPSTNIQLELRRSAHAVIRVHDANGKEVAEIFDKFAGAGTHEIVFSSDGLSSGVYFYTLMLDGINAASRRMVVLK